ncbi:glycosyltransferase family 39 protein [Candidatus Woesearchaeota archaeon]|nr:glycosyltransferase family 39 protein [Candidatus Woesearchaeota archaeon]
MSLLDKFRRMEKYEKYALIVIILGILLRFSLASVHHASGDACWQFSNAIYLAENNRFPLFEFFGRDEPFWAPPFFHILTALVYKIFSAFGKEIAGFAIKMITPLLGSLTLITFFLISKILFDKKTAFYALLFFTFIPLSIDYSVFSYVDGTITFLAALSVYLALKNRIILSAIAAGLTILTKYNGFFILPVLLFIIFKNYNGKKYLLKNILIISILPTLIGSIWFIRNWIYLGNPVWPFMNTIFNGYEAKTFAEAGVGAINPSNIFSLSGLAAFYLGIFGVPDGNISTLSFLQLPYLNILFGIWLLSTFIFFIPLVTGVASKKLNHKNLLYVWIGSYIILVLLYVINSSWSVTRFMLPAVPAVALIWAHGLERIKHGKIRKLLIMLILLIIAGFISTSFAKISIAAASWNSYNDDFKWAKSNTAKNAIFMTGSQCISYNIERQTVSPIKENIEKADYIFVNQKFRLDNRAKLNNDIINELNNKKIGIVYENQKTGTKVYRIS